jgi:outer membrane translocation and assembly module TamA
MAEYRWRPSRYLDMAVFVDTGTVAPRLKDVPDERFSTSWGIGARFHGPGFTAFRIEAAHGREGWNIVFASGQPF